MKAELPGNTSLLHKATSYVEDQASEAGLSRRDFLLSTLTLIGVEALGAAYITDLVRYGDDNTLIVVQNVMSRDDTPDHVKKSLSYVPLGMGIATFALLENESIKQFAKRGGGRRAFLRFLWETPRNIGYSLVASGFGFFFEPTVIGFSVDNYYRGQREKRERYERNVTSIRNMIGETLHRPGQHVSLDNYQGESKASILRVAELLRQSFVSKDPTTRITAKHVFAWACLAPTGDKTVYDTYVRDVLRLDPNEANMSDEDAEKLALFLETFDTATDQIDKEVATRKLEYPTASIANAMIEGTFRSMALILQPESDAWEEDKFTLSKMFISTAPMVNRTKYGAPSFTPFQSGDSASSSTAYFSVMLDAH